MARNIKKILINKINESEWWHVLPQDQDAYKKRGKFLASTYSQAEFYGRPQDTSERVNITNPIYGYSEKEILMKLFHTDYQTLIDGLENSGKNWYSTRIDLDAKMFVKAKIIGYDAIVLLTKSAKKDLENNRKPKSIELNLLSV